MTPVEAKEYILKKQTRLVYVSGKTCSGKTTFSSDLEKEGHTRIELDKIVMESVVHAFRVEPGVGFLTAYRGEGPEEQTASFVATAKNTFPKQ
jgi:tRNA uridine 5-carbamoylmethylation protein Kti12